jgi:AcrR family transcriptional regulator
MGAGAARRSGSDCQPSVNRVGRLGALSTPAYKRLDVDERRAQLLELGTRLFAEHSYEDLSMAQIARQAGISKALLYHYFPSKEEFFRAALGEAAAELARRTAPDESLPPLEQVRAGTEAFVDWIGERGQAYAKLLQSVGAVPELRDTMTQIRDFTSGRILDGLVPEAERTPAKRAAVRGWLWYMDGVLLDWIEHGDRKPAEVADGLVESLLALIAAA